MEEIGRVEVLQPVGRLLDDRTDHLFLRMSRASDAYRKTLASLQLVVLAQVLQHAKERAF